MSPQHFRPILTILFYCNSQYLLAKTKVKRPKPSFLTNQWNCVTYNFGAKWYCVVMWVTWKFDDPPPPLLIRACKRVDSNAYTQVLGTGQSNGNVEIEARWLPYWIPRWPPEIWYTHSAKTITDKARFQGGRLQIRPKLHPENGGHIGFQDGRRRQVFLPYICSVNRVNPRVISLP
jgi:hypothetical protein